MGGNRGATIAHTLATWTRLGLVAVGWLVLAFIIALAGLANIGLIDVAPYLAGPDGFPYSFDVVGPANRPEGK
jgi:hypothetical protein